MLCCCGFVESWKTALEPLLLLYGISTFSTKKKNNGEGIKGVLSTIPRSTIPFSLFIGKRSVNNGARQGWKPEVQHDSKDKPDSDAAAY